MDSAMLSKPEPPSHQKWPLLARLSMDVTRLAQQGSQSLPPAELQQFACHLRWLSDMLSVECANVAHPQ